MFEHERALRARERVLGVLWVVLGAHDELRDDIWGSGRERARGSVNPLRAFPLVLVLVLPVASASLLPVVGVPGDRPDLIVPPASDPSPSCRIVGPPVSLTILVTSEAQGVAVREAFWAAGIPPGSHVRTIMGMDAPAGAVRAPEAPSRAWAETVLGASCN